MRLRLGIGLMSVLTVAACTQAPVPTAVPSSVPTSTDSSRPARAGSAPVPPRVSSAPSAQVSATSIVGRPTIVLNPGHNGGNAEAAETIARLVDSGFGQTKACDTTGTETNDTGYPEHAFAWDVALRTRTLLQARGVRVVMTRSSDTGVGPCVDERARIGNQSGVAAVVSIHADGAATDGHGFHVEECSRQPAGAAIAAMSHRLTVAEHAALLRGSGLTVSNYLGINGYLARDDLAGLNLATVPATFLELGNMRNDGDAAIQSSPAGRQRIAQAIATGILTWLASR